MTEVTWAADDQPSARWQLYTRGNVGEVFPDVVYPLTWRLLGKQAEDGWRDAFGDFGVLAPGDLGDESMVILGVFGGYCYINASYVRILGVRTPGLAVETIDRDFFGESDAPPYSPRPGDKNRRASLRIARTIASTLFAKEVNGLDEDVAQVDAFRARLPSPEAADAAFVDYLTSYQPLFRQLFRRHIFTSFRATIGLGVVNDLCAAVGDPSLVVQLLGGLGGVESAAPSAALWELGRLARADPIAFQFEAGLPGLHGRLMSEAAASELRMGIDRFLQNFGYRGPNEWDLASQTWDADITRVYAAIDSMRRADESHAPTARHAALERDRLAATADVRARLSRMQRMQFDRALASVQLFSQARERSKSTVIRASHGARLALRELVARTRDRGVDNVADLCLLTPSELRSYLVDPASLLPVVRARRAQHTELTAKIPPFIFEGTQPPPDRWASRDSATHSVASGSVLQGIPGCPGIARGRARVVLDPGDPRGLGPGDVLVAPITDPSWTPLFVPAEAVVVDVGATMSHAVIVSRELGIPCVVSVTGGTRTIPDGALIEVDGAAGTVTVLEVT